jgi:hypothetical protein
MLANLLPPASKAITAQEAGSVTRRTRTSIASRSVSAEGRVAAERALARLRVLRDGWNDVNRQFIKQDFVAAQRLAGREYEVQYLEAKAAVGDALQVLPKGEVLLLRIFALECIGIFHECLLVVEALYRRDAYPLQLHYVQGRRIPHWLIEESTEGELTVHWWTSRPLSSFFGQNSSYFKSCKENL